MLKHLTRYKTKKHTMSVLKKIYGIGICNSKHILKRCNININSRFNKIDIYNKTLIHQYIKKNILNENQLKTQKKEIIRSIISLKAYKGKRYLSKLPVNGQRTRSNARNAKKIRI